MEYKRLDTRTSVIQLKEKEIGHIHRMFEEFKYYLEENKIDEPWIGLNRLGMFPLKWVKLE